MRTVTIYAIANSPSSKVSQDAQAMRPVKQLFIPYYEGEAYDFEIILLRDWETKTPVGLPDDIALWEFYMDRDFDRETPPLISMTDPIRNLFLIKAHQTAEETRISIHCSQFGGQVMREFIGEYGYRDGLYADLIGFDAERNGSFAVTFDNIMVGLPYDEMTVYAIAGTRFPAWLRDPQNMMKVESLFFPAKKSVGIIFDFVLFKEPFEATPATLPDNIVSWEFAIDIDYDKQTVPLALGDNDQITVYQTEEETKVRVPCSQMGGQTVLDFIDQTGYRVGIYAELAGYDKDRNTVFLLPIKGIRIGAPYEQPIVPEIPRIQ